MPKEYLDKAGLQRYTEGIKKLIESSGGGDSSIPVIELSLEEIVTETLSTEKTNEIALSLENNLQTVAKVVITDKIYMITFNFIASVSINYTGIDISFVADMISSYILNGNKGDVVPMLVSIVLSPSDNGDDSFEATFLKDPIVSNMTTQSIFGTKTFLSIPKCENTPQSDSDLVNKKYVDDKIEELRQSLQPK